MDPAENKCAVEAFKRHGVWNVTWIWEVQSKFHIDTKDIHNLCVCLKLSFVKPKHIELVGPYKKRLNYDIDTAYVCKTPHKDINEGHHFLQIFPKDYGK